jgi:hypothetical protein
MDFFLVLVWGNSLLQFVHVFRYTLYTLYEESNLTTQVIKFDNTTMANYAGSVSGNYGRRADAQETPIPKICREMEKKKKKIG